MSTMPVGTLPMGNVDCEVRREVSAGDSGKRERRIAGIARRDALKAMVVAGSAAFFVFSYLYVWLRVDPSLIYH
ncbi:MAG: hypothetical protein KAX19_05445, partial [Candidatus Brocadiae bacterium]|nr:hypothetical protein [Candidatus Brocadiia bacterium]